MNSLDRSRAEIAASRAASEELAQRVGNRSAPVRRAFISLLPSEKKNTRVPPLLRILHTRRGAEARLKLYLSLLWVAAAPPFDVHAPARAWAEVIGLPDPTGRGARTVSSAIGWLERNNLVMVERTAGHSSRLYLLHESGDGLQYSKPGESLVRAKKDDVGRERHFYMQLPSTFWTSGWLATLTPSAVAMYLLIRSESQGGKRREVWLSPSVLRENYGFSDGVRSAGVKELQRHGLITARSELVAGTTLEMRRRRKVYMLADHRLATFPTESE